MDESTNQPIQPCSVLTHDDMFQYVSGADFLCESFSDAFVDSQRLNSEGLAMLSSSLSSSPGLFWYCFMKHHRNTMQTPCH